MNTMNTYFVFRQSIYKYEAMTGTAKMDRHFESFTDSYFILLLSPFSMNFSPNVIAHLVR